LKPSSRKTGKRKAITSSKDGSDESSDGIIQIRCTSKKVATKRARRSVEVEEEVVEEDEDTLEAANTVDECSASLREKHEEDGDYDEPVSFLCWIWWYFTQRELKKDTDGIDLEHIHHAALPEGIKTKKK
jgi:hypothetical protein